MDHVVQLGLPTLEKGGCLGDLHDPSQFRVNVIDAVQHPLHNDSISASAVVVGVDTGLPFDAVGLHLHWGFLEVLGPEAQVGRPLRRISCDALLP